jgi:hypothetical protein
VIDLSHFFPLKGEDPACSFSTGAGLICAGRAFVAPADRTSLSR